MNDSRPPVSSLDSLGNTEVFRTLVEALPDAILVTSEDQIVFVNPSCVKLFGAEQAEQLLGKKIFELIHPDSYKGCGDRIRDCYNGRKSSARLENVFVSLSGSLLSTEAEPVLISWQGKAALEFVVRDTSARMRAEGRLREYERVVESLEEMIVVVDRQYRYVIANRAFLEYRHKSVEEVIGRPLWEVLTQEVFERAIKPRLDECFEGKVVRFEWKHSYPEIGERDLYYSYFPIEDAEGVSGAACVLLDQTEQKRLEQAELLWTKRMELAEQAGLRIGLWDWEIKANKVIWSDETYRQFGFTRETFSGRLEDAAERIHPEDRAMVDEAIQNAIAGSTQYAAQYRVVCPDGTLRWIDAHGVILRNGEERMLGIGIDITELKNTEQTLRQSEERYRGLFENASYGICRSNFAGELLDANTALVEMLGCASKEELLSLNIRNDIYEDPSARDKILEQCKAAGRVSDHEVRWKRRDGNILHVRLYARMLPKDHGGAVEMEVIADDITLRRNLEQQLRHAQKMEAVGRLAGGIAHDFNNLLMVIQSYTYLLQESLAENDVLRRNTHEVLKATERAASLTKQLLAFGRKQVRTVVRLDMNAVVCEAAKMLRRLIGEDVECRLNLAESLRTIEADADQIVQILMNLCVNAKDAMPQGGALTISTGNVTVKTGSIDGQHSYVIPGEYVCLSVTDTGTGISKELQERIFEPFFTTKEVGKGTGLGLATVYGIVKQSGGYVWVESEPGHGASFIIYLPVTCGAISEEASVGGESWLKGTETLLLVEDEGAVRESIGEFLRGLGYTVLTAESGEQALAVAEKHEGAIHLLITDIVMPKMSGRALSQLLQSSCPEMKTIYMSGYSDDAALQTGIHEQGATFMQKPFSLGTLAKKVRERLRSPEGK